MINNKLIQTIRFKNKNQENHHNLQKRKNQSF